MYKKGRPEKHRGRHEEAQTLVEFVLVSMVTLTIVMGLIEFGRLLQTWLTVQNSAQAGARFAITGQCFTDPAIDPWDSARLECIKTEARHLASSLNIDDSAASREAGYFAVTVRASDPPAPTVGMEYPGGPNMRVAVHVVYNHELITPIVREIVPWITLRARSEMVTERYRRPGLDAIPDELPPAIPIIISGYVLASDGAGINGVLLDGLPNNPFTDSSGLYMDEVPPGWDGEVTPRKASFNFDPGTRYYTSVTSDMPSEDYVETSP